VTILAGTEEKKFTVHKDIICRFDYFQEAFRHESTILFPDVSPTAVSLFIVYLYKGSVAMGNTEEYLHDLVDLYILADGSEMVDLKDKTMDCIQDMSAKYGLLEEVTNLELVKRVYDKTHAKYEGLRKYLIHLTAFEHDAAIKDLTPRGAEAVIPYLSAEYLESLRNYTKDHPEILLGVVKCHQFRLSDELRNKFVPEMKEDIYDPRERDESYLSSRCFFHCHRKRTDCREVPPSDDALFVASERLYVE